MYRLRTVAALRAHGRRRRIAPGVDAGTVGGKNAASCREPTMYLRFVILRHDAGSHRRQGVFQAAFSLRDSGELAGHELEWMADELEWLGTHLPAPAVLREDGRLRALSWFKPSAADAIARVRSLAALLDEHGNTVEQITSRDPGTTVYEDDWQVVAFPPRRRRGRAAGRRRR